MNFDCGCLLTLLDFGLGRCRLFFFRLTTTGLVNYGFMFLGGWVFPLTRD